MNKQDELTLGELKVRIENNEMVAVMADRGTTVVVWTFDGARVVARDRLRDLTAADKLLWYETHFAHLKPVPEPPA